MLARGSRDISIRSPSILSRVSGTIKQYQRPLPRLVRSHPVTSAAFCLTVIALLPLYIYSSTFAASISSLLSPRDGWLYDAALDTQYPSSRYERSVSTFTHPLTITTAYFPFPSKHSSNEYHQWLSNFLTHNPTPVVVYTTAAFYPQMAAIRYRELFVNCSAERFTLVSANALHRVACPLQSDRSLLDLPTHFNLSYSSPLELPITALYSSYWDAQLAVDPERAKHSPTLYATWNAKAYLVNETATLNPFHSKYFAWMDAGQFRNAARPWRSAVDAHKLAVVFGEVEAGLSERPPFCAYDGGRHPHPSTSAVVSRQHKLLVNLVHPFPASYCMPFDPFTTSPATLLSDHTAGQSFVGTAAAIRWYADVYYRLLLSYQSRGLVWGKDQNVANGITFAYKGSVMLLGTWKVAGRSECVVGRGWDAHWSWMGEWLQRRTKQHERSCADEMYAVDGMVVEGQAVCDGTHADWLAQSDIEASRLQGPPAPVAIAEAAQTHLSKDSG